LAWRGGVVARCKPAIWRGDKVARWRGVVAWHGDKVTDRPRHDPELAGSPLNVKGEGWRAPMVATLCKPLSSPLRATSPKRARLAPCAKLATMSPSLSLYPTLAYYLAFLDIAPSFATR
jgi:hypothetical protein